MKLIPQNLWIRPVFCQKYLQHWKLKRHFVVTISVGAQAQTVLSMWVTSMVICVLIGCVITQMDESVFVTTPWFLGVSKNFIMMSLQKKIYCNKKLSILFSLLYFTFPFVLARDMFQKMHCDDFNICLHGGINIKLILHLKLFYKKRQRKLKPLFKFQILLLVTIMVTTWMTSIVM